MNIRYASIEDMSKIKSLYSEVAKTEGGIARFQYEITESYILEFIKNSVESGVILVAENESRDIIGEIHTYRSGLRVFDHVFTNLTIAVSPNHENKGKKLFFTLLEIVEKNKDILRVGKKLFFTLLEIVEKNKDILRVELIARESNKKAIDFYKKLGFEIEGALRNKIKNSNGKMESDIIMGWIKK
ncbi:GNAT family N-acetyltransferase [uncultured Ilyobacter sp.]|uniref:GNAT family N-acetyltransferase n=1 Tax=uncultured Ilyobacter sp. TaxID=544433 RepID=UPI0029C63DC2|nr:GNAT family N-acetyltransferase [uncultured Ilyobacter sp.]